MRTKLTLNLAVSINFARLYDVTHTCMHAYIHKHMHTHVQVHDGWFVLMDEDITLLTSEPPHTSRFNIQWCPWPGT